jgi:hypothetical protein
MKKKKSARPSRQAKPKIYHIYGVFDYKTNTLMSVSLKQEEVELEYDLEGYDEERYDIISFEVTMT